MTHVDDLTHARREQVLAAIVAAGAAGVSGEHLAHALSCSRASIHRHVQALRRAGVAIDGVHEGYVLGADADPVVASLIEAGLREPIAGPVRWRSTTASTNDDAAAAARAGEAEGLVFGADHQTSGRGRRGRPWLSDPTGGLTFSVLLRPPVAPIDVGLLPLLVAVAVASAIGPDARIVWPNDIVMGDAKVCGILCESAVDEAAVAWAVAGIGVNVGAVPDLDEVRWRPGAVAAVRPVRRGQLLTRILVELADRYERWIAQGASSIVTDYTDRDALAGRSVVARTASGEIAGQALGIDEFGRLRVSAAEGTVALGSAEVLRIER